MWYWSFWYIIAKMVSTEEAKTLIFFTCLCLSYWTDGLWRTPQHPATSSVEEEQCMGPREPPFCDSLRASSARGIDPPTGLLPHRFIKQVSSISKAYHFALILLCDSPSLLVIVRAELPSWHGGEALIWWSTHSNLTYWKGVPLCSV